MILRLVPYSLSARQGEQSKPTAVLGKDAAVTHVTQDRRMFGGHFCGVDNSYFQLWSDMVLEGACFCLDPSRSQRGLV